MKKLLAIMLAATFIFSACIMTGCSGSGDDKGAIVQMYISSFPKNLDPTASVYNSDETAKIFSLLYEGLFTISADGKLKNALADECEEYVDARDNTLKLEISLKESRWSDGIPVSASDFVYAWQRLLKPENNNSAAALLFPIKNAKLVKEGRCSINDLGVYAIKEDVIQIAFEDDFTDVEYFKRRLASPMLIPLREDNVSKFDDPSNDAYTWDASKAAGLPVTNGPFKYKNIRSYALEFERNLHFRNVGDNDDNPVDKVVTPYQLITSYEDAKNAEEQLERYKNGEIFYINLSEADAETIKAAGKVTQTAVPSVYTYFFDTTSEMFSDANVRKALSIALDREYLNTLTGRKTKAAQGIVPSGIDDKDAKSDFRKKAGNLFAPKGDMETAKALLSEAGAKKGNISILYNKDRAYEKAVAEYVKQVWDELGYRVVPTATSSAKMAEYATGKTVFATGEARVIGMDFRAVTPDAYSMLIEFGTDYHGSAVDLSIDETTYTTAHITGFSDEEYDAVCDKIVSANTASERAGAMHEAEAMLIEKSPVVPLFSNVDVYASKKLSKISADAFGGKNFTKIVQKDYKKYLPEEE